jgi:hypothetical protein
MDALDPSRWVKDPVLSQMLGENPVLERFTSFTFEELGALYDGLECVGSIVAESLLEEVGNVIATFDVAVMEGLIE